MRPAHTLLPSVHLTAARHQGHGGSTSSPLRPRRRRPKHKSVCRREYLVKAHISSIGLPGGRRPSLSLAGRKGGHPAGDTAGVAASPQAEGALAVMPDPGGQAMLIESRTASRPEADMSFKASR